MYVKQNRNVLQPFTRKTNSAPHARHAEVGHGSSVQVMQKRSPTGMLWKLSVSSRKLTYPTWGKGKSSSNMPYQGDMLIPWRVGHFNSFYYNNHGSTVND